MAPSHHVQNENLSDRPFADYFWIAGLDGSDLLSAYRSHTESLDSFTAYEAPGDRRLSATIQEDTVAEGNDAFSMVESPVLENQESRRNSYHRLSKLSNEARRSIQSLDGIAKLHSNRSSATIKPALSPGGQSPGYRMSTTISDIDFDIALKNFASDRDTFFLNIDLRNDNSPRSPPTKSKAKTQRVVSGDLDATPSRSLGSVRRHMSFRDMNSTRRQASMARRTSTRTSKRISTYNAVIPQPETIQTSPNRHPLRRTFEPALLDRFPRPDMTDEIKRRNAFPDYVPMFAFPNDIHVISSDTRPPTTWHEFSMTAANNSKIPAVCVIVWIPMNRETADELEKLCEQWRKANLSDAERELAASLGERLAQERAKLSVLLSKLPQMAQGSEDRELLEDQIGAVEEKITLMSEMLRPLRHGAANRIEGLTDGDTGLWVPRAYGILGRDESMAPVWKEWLKAVVVPMMDGAVLRVPPSSPRVGMWQPLERYVMNICCEAKLPASSRIQVELTVRELRLFAKKEAPNELPGSRSTDLYPLFRALSIPNIVAFFEYMLAEARIIIVSSQVSMLKLVSKAMIQLLWPFEWAGVYIPVLPARLMQVLEAPCPYICGVVRKGDKITLPDEDFVMVDLDKNELHATEQPTPLPRQFRRKLMSLLYLAVPHHHSRGVPVGPPPTAVQAFPNNAFSSENTSLFSPAALPTNISTLASLSSSMFGVQAASEQSRRTPLLNAFLHFSPSVKGIDRPMTANTSRQPSQPGSDSASPSISTFPPLPHTPLSRNDSGFALQTSLREKRSGHFDALAKSSETFSSIRRKASIPFARHGPSPSIASVSPMSESTSFYASSSYAPSTMAASTVMPGMTFQPARNTESQTWVEGHCLVWQPASRSLCTCCNEPIDSDYYRCSGCGLVTHAQCGSQIPVVCQAAFYPDQVRAAFARFFATLLYSYKKFMSPVNGEQKKQGMACQINVDAWIRSMSPEHSAYMELLRQTQAFNEFVAEREQSAPTSPDSVRLFDALLIAKKARSGRLRPNFGNIALGRKPFGRSVSNGAVDFMSDESSQIWRLVSFAIGSEKPDLSGAAHGRDYHTISTRTPAKLENGFLVKSERKQRSNTAYGADKYTVLKHRMNGLSMNAP